MHVGNMTKGMVPGIAIVGGGIPLAAGMALAFKMQKTDQVVACFFGDGAVAEGAFHEGVNMAAIWNLPVVFVCENNLYGASTRIDLVMKNPHIADRAASYGIRGETVDGNDVLAVYEAAETRGGAMPRRRRARCCWSCSPTAGPATRAATPATTSRRRSGRRGPRATRSSVSPRACRREGVIDEAGVERMRARAAQRFAEAVEKARSAPQPRSTTSKPTSSRAEAAP